MGFGLEVRVPFLDQEFLDIAMTIDPSEKLCKDGNEYDIRHERDNLFMGTTCILGTTENWFP